MYSFLGLHYTKIIIQHSIHRIDSIGLADDKIYFPMNLKKILNSYDGRHSDQQLHLIKQCKSHFAHLAIT